MRQQLARRSKRIAELENRAPKPIDVGEKPTMAGCDFDEERYEAELDAFKERKAAADRQTQTQAEQNRKLPTKPGSRTCLSSSRRRARSSSMTATM
jgi:hypothetical protein